MNKCNIFLYNFRNDAVIMTNGIPLYYEVAGKGDNVALCLPGALGIYIHEQFHL